MFPLHLEKWGATIHRPGSSFKVPCFVQGHPGIAQEETWDFSNYQAKLYIGPGGNLNLSPLIPMPRLDYCAISASNSCYPQNMYRFFVSGFR